MEVRFCFSLNTVIFIFSIKLIKRHSLDTIKKFLSIKETEIDSLTSVVKNTLYEYYTIK